MAAEPLLWALAASDVGSLRERARKLREQVLRTPADALPELARASNAAVAELPERAVVSGLTGEQIAARLESLAAGRADPGLLRGRALERPRVGFVFSPLRSEYPGMCTDLIATRTAFANGFAAFATALEPLTGWSALDVLHARDAAALKRLDIGQPLLVAVSTALSGLWQAAGVGADAVLGHSVGEIAAAVACGALSVEDGARVASTWGDSSRRLEGTGAMAAIPLPAAELELRLRRLPGEAFVSSVNSPTRSAVSGSPGTVAELLAELAADGIEGRSMGIEAPGHSVGMESIDEWFSEELKTISPQAAAVPYYSALEGRRVDPEALDAAYWSRNLRRPVQFEAALRALRADGCNVFVEIGPRPVLIGAIEEILAGEEDVVTLGGWEQGDAAQFPLALADAYVHGVGVDLRAFDPVLTEPPAAAAADSLRSRIASVPATEGRRLLTELVGDVLADLAGSRVAAAATEGRAFRDLGLDSQAAVSLCNRLSRQAGVELAPTAVFDHPTVEALAEHLARRLRGDPDEGRSPQPSRAPQRRHEPIAIVGIGCRYPGGAESPQDLWEIVADAREAIGDFPDDRGWDLPGLFDPDPERAGTSYVQTGGFLHDAAEFDATFFGIGPREARAMDPQQRIALECAWEAVEAAAIDPKSLAGEPIGTFVGAFASAYGPDIRDAGIGVAGHLLTGTTPSVIAGRIAYVLGLEGPTMTVDTACSSSLVAIHLACQSLRRGEAELALAGGVTVMSTPDLFVEFSRQRALAPDGRCKSFAAEADGTAWSEGCGMLLLGTLSEARRRGLPVLGLVRGSAINQDGASNGLTAPSGRAQEGVIGQALADAGLTPAAVDAVEAHGTGTTLGDPIEAQALLSAYGHERVGEPLRLGSIKSNIGHCSAASGVAGTIKMVMALRHEMLPRTLHVERPSPAIAWESGAVELLREPLPWRRGERTRRAAVSSFGISGTNAHLLLEEAPTEDETRAAELVAAPLGFPLSAESEEALRAQARRLGRHLRANPALALDDVAVTLANRPRFARRAAVVAADREPLLVALAALADDEPAAGLARGDGRRRREVAFVFPGLGTPWAGIGARMRRIWPRFESRMRACEAAIAAVVDWSPETTFNDAGALEHGPAAAARFALTVSLADLWEAHGVTPTAVLGDGLGLIAAAHFAGALPLEEAARLLALNSAAPGPPGKLTLPGLDTGRIAVIPATAEKAEGDEELDTEPRRRGKDNPADLTAAACRLVGTGCEALIEVSLHPVLTSALEATAGVPVVATLSRERPEPEAFLAALGAAHGAGIDVDWKPAAGGGRAVTLPTYPFQRRRHWLGPAEHGTRPSAGLESIEHPFLTGVLQLAGEDRRLLCGSLSLDAQPWLSDHLIHGQALLPAGAFVELALTAAALDGRSLAALTLEAPLALPAGATVALQLVLSGDSSGGAGLAIYSRREGQEWERHAGGRLGARAKPDSRRAPTGPPPGSRPLDVDLLYRRLAARGMEYGPSFSLVREAWRQGEETGALLELADSESETGFAIHPTLLEAALHLTFDDEAGSDATDGALVPFSWSGVRLAGGRHPRVLSVRMTQSRDGGVELTGVGEDGLVLLSVGLLRTRALAPRPLNSTAA